MIPHMYVLILSIVAGGLYSTIWWLGAVIDPTKTTEKFSVTKLLITMSIGAAVGLVFIYGQISLKDISIWLQMVIYAALTAVSRYVLFSVGRKVMK
jgi:hypothetical protein